MNLYRVYQNENDNYDTYSEAVVCAKSSEEARTMHPSGKQLPVEPDKWFYRDWAEPEHVNVELIGTAADDVKKGVVCASFHAG